MGYWVRTCRALNDKKLFELQKVFLRRCHVFVATWLAKEPLFFCEKAEHLALHFLKPENQDSLIFLTPIVQATSIKYTLVLEMRVLFSYTGFS